MSAGEAIAFDVDYEFRQRDRDGDYQRAYDEWKASLSEEERQHLDDLGIADAYLPASAAVAPGGDVAESPAARCEPAPLTEDGDDDSDEVTEFADRECFHDLLRRLVGELIGKDNARLSLECLALVTGLAYCGDSMTSIAGRHGVTRAAVSKRCVELTCALNLKPSRAMRSEEARSSYRRARFDHLRKQA